MPSRNDSPNRSEAFGRLLSGAINSIATYEGRATPIIEEDLGQLLTLAGKTIQRYKAGHLPPEARTVEVLAEAAVQRGYLGREWLQRFLHAARYPFADKLLNRLCPTTPVRPRPPRVYENLPAPTYSQFVMRQQAFNEVTDGLSKRTAAVLIVGLGGNGKTSLAREVAVHSLQDGAATRRFDAVVWISDKDHPGTTNLSIMLDEIARTLDYPGFTQFEHDEKRREVEQLLRRQRVLLIVDNFETVTDQALLTWLLNLPEPSKALITSREKHRGLWSSWLVELRGMAESEAWELITERARALKIDRLVSERAQLEPLLAATGGNPKALAMTLGLLKYERRSLQDMVDDLYAARGDLFEDLFARAWALLDEAARRVLLVATFFPATANGEALSATADVQGFAFDRAVERLADLALVDIHQHDLNTAPRYALHPLVRAFAGVKLHEQVVFAEAAQNRWASYFYSLISQYNADGWDFPYQFDRAEQDISNFHALLQHCHETHRWEWLVNATLMLRSFWNTRGYYDTRNQFIDLALQVAEQINRTEEQIRLLCIKARAMCFRDDLISATACIQHAQNLLATLTNPDPSLVISFYYACLPLHEIRGEFDEMYNLATKSIEIARKHDWPLQILLQYDIAEYYYYVGRFHEAKELFQSLIAASIEHGYHRRPISGWMYLAKIAMDLGDLDEAEMYLQRGEEQALKIQHQSFIAEARRNRSKLHELRGDLAMARAVLEEAIDLFERLGMRRELPEARAAMADLDARELAELAT